ncbi:Kap104p [Sugiyamaella lignohabitans]|uniref:Kap104p n=1 Tax=Sugiyamaella lignohabitans TaxID=796027 RepID=A0A167FXQ9_9ASCO|nr:Kap104p [Sugiyamaella lignohabitans]ANB15835.1 Kap104p [Sugiyamaella lignohabitans]
MSWSPQPEALSQLAQVLAHSTSSSKQYRSQARKALDDAKSQPDLDNYLAYLLVNHSDAVGQDVRGTAGLLLKNNIRPRYAQLPAESQNYIKTEVLKGLTDPVSLVRNVAGNVITTLVSVAGIEGWPEVLPNLMSMAETGDVRAQEGAMSALAKICEDSASQLDAVYDGQRPLNFMVPKFLQFTTSSSPKVRSQSIFCLTQFILISSQALLAHLDTFLNTLFSLASDNDSDIRRNICSAFVLLLEVRSDKLLPHLEGVINYTLHCIKDEDEQLASEACEFILGLAESSVPQDQIEPHLPKILPVILSTMVYSEVDKYILEGIDEDDAQVADKAEDVKPVNIKSKNAHSVEKKTGEDDSSKHKESKSLHYEEEDGVNDQDDQDDDDDEEDFEGGLEEWNLRKCSAAALDVFASNFADTVVQISLPYLTENIVSSEWSIREAAILAFGAIAEGCVSQVDVHLPQLIQYLVARLGDKEAPVRQIACWTLSRYSPWVVDHSKTDHQQYFVPVLEGLLKCCLDRNKKVQEAGCSGFSVFAENARESILPYLGVSLQQLSLCFRKYQAKNMLALYDTIQTLVDSVPEGISEPQHIGLILPPLLEKWSQMKDDDRDLTPLLECLSTITATAGEQFSPYAPTVFERTCASLKNNLIQEQAYQQDPSSVDGPDKDFIITNLDLLDGIVQGLGEHASQLISQAQQPPFVEMVLACFQDELLEVRQSAFALLGDMAIYTYDQLKPFISTILRETISQIDSSNPHAAAVCNNAIWSAGEIALQITREEIEPFVQELLQRLVQVLQSPAVDTVLENAAIAIGRLGKVCADIVAPHIGLFIDKWCTSIKYVDETDEKDSAFQGICHIIAANPSGLSNEKSLLVFIDTIAIYNEPSHALAMLISKVLEGYKGFISDWDKRVMAQLSQESANSLRQRYGL